MVLVNEVSEFAFLALAAFAIEAEIVTRLTEVEVVNLVS